MSEEDIMEISSDSEDDKLVIVEDAEEKLPDVFLLPHEKNNPADQPGRTEDGEVDEESKLPEKRKRVKGEKEKKKKKAKKQKKCKPEETEEVDMNVKASEEMKEAETNRNEDLPSTSAANISEDLFDNDDELEDFMSQSAESAALLEKVQNSEELGVGTTPKTQKVLSEEERLSAHINSLIESNADSDEPANKAWANLAIAEKRALTVINRFNGSKAKGADLRKAISNFNVEEYKMNSTVLREWKNCLSKCMSIVQSEMQKPNIEKASKLFYQSQMTAIKKSLEDVKLLEKEIEDTDKLLKQMSTAFSSHFEQKMSTMAVKAVSIKNSIKDIKKKFTLLSDIDFKPSDH